MSLLSGAVLLAAGMYLFYLPPAGTEQHRASYWNAETVRIVAGSGTWSGRTLRLKLDEKGRGAVVLRNFQVDSGDYPFLHLGFQEAPSDYSVMLLWSNARSRGKTLRYRIPDTSRASIWLALNEFAYWDGKIGGLGVSLQGPPGDELVITDFEPLAASLRGQLATIYWNWTSFKPWLKSAINSHLGITETSSFYPVPVAAALLILSLAAYACLLFLFRANMRLDWRVVAAVFLVCWISLDLVWQGRLLRQWQVTHETFSGKDAAGKLAAGPDAQLVAFIADIKKQVQPSDGRIFVNSTSDYLGMRAGYFLYPFNVYWERHATELPKGKYIRSGDHVVLIGPTETRFDAQREMLLMPNDRTLGVERLVSRPMGSVFRVK
jgi:hypothetical protein